MDDEKFSIFFDLNGDERFYDVIPKIGSNELGYEFEIWKDDKHLFTVHPEFDENTLTTWLLDDRYDGIYYETVQEVGQAIENHLM